MDTSFPVFGSQGQEGDLTGDGMNDAVSTDPAVALASLPDSAFTAGAPTATFRDVAVEAEEREREWHRLQMQLHPELTQAFDTLKRREFEVENWTNICMTQRAEVARLELLVQRSRGSLEHFDSEPGTRSERLAAAQERLTESLEELFAAQEELQIAKQRMEVLAK